MLCSRNFLLLPLDDGAGFEDAEDDGEDNDDEDRDEDGFTNAFLLIRRPIIIQSLLDVFLSSLRGYRRPGGRKAGKRRKWGNI